MAKRDRLLNEQEHHKKAFIVYYELGEKRSVKQVAEQIGVSLSTVKLWSRSFGWQQRVRERDAEVARQVADRTLKSDVDESERNIKIVRLAMVRLARAIADGKVRMQLSDLDRLIRLQSLLEGQPDPAGVPQTADELIDLFATVDPEVTKAAFEKMERMGYGADCQPAGDDE